MASRDLDADDRLSTDDPDPEPDAETDAPSDAADDDRLYCQICGVWNPEGVEHEIQDHILREHRFPERMAALYGPEPPETADE